MSQDDLDLNEENYCFVCGRHETRKCVGGLTGRVLRVKHDASLVRSAPAAIRKPPLFIAISKGD